MRHALVITLISAVSGLLSIETSRPIIAQEPVSATEPAATAAATSASEESPSQESASQASPSQASPSQESGSDLLDLLVPAENATSESSQSGAASQAEPTSDAVSAAASASEDAMISTSETPTDPIARQARLKELLTLVTDSTLFSNRRESPAYFALVKEVLDQTPEELRAKARDNPRFNDFYRQPAAHRGEVVHLVLNLRRVIRLPIKAKNEAGVTELFELWGWTEEAKAWMYCCIVPELPPGIEEGDSVNHRIELTGYFFKMQAYQPGGAAPNARNLVAPLVIGRITQAEAKQVASSSIGNWPLILIVGFGGLIFLRLMMRLRSFGRPVATHRNYRRRSLEPIDADNLGDALGGQDRGLKIRNANEV